MRTLYTGGSGAKWVGSSRAFCRISTLLLGIDRNSGIKSMRSWIDSGFLGALDDHVIIVIVVFVIEIVAVVAVIRLELALGMLPGDFFG